LSIEATEGVLVRWGVEGGEDDRLFVVESGSGNSSGRRGDSLEAIKCEPVSSFVHQVLSVPGDGAWDWDQAGGAGDVGLEAEVLLECPEIVDVVMDMMGCGQ
jgi:hypothetical protein